MISLSFLGKFAKVFFNIINLKKQYIFVVVVFVLKQKKVIKRKIFLKIFEFLFGKMLSKLLSKIFI